MHHFLLFLLVLGAMLLPGQVIVANTLDGSKPNFVLIITDDQDLMMDSLSYQPSVQNQFWKQGIFYSKHFCTMAQCCPSRVSILTGKCGHNTNITSVIEPYGGYSKFVCDGWNDQYLPVWLQGAGYNTYYVGKLMNGHNVTNYDSPYPRGWTGSESTITNNTYKALRIVSEQFDFLHTVWCTNEKELYDMTTDPGQMKNIHSASADGANVANFPVLQLETRLDALMMVLKYCKGQAECMTPWRVLHPQGDVSNLIEAMDGRFDVFYAKQPKVSYSSCQNGYIIEVEGPQTATPFQ